MTAILLLFLLGVVCLFFEVFLPGMIMGAIGGALMLAGCVAAGLRYGAEGALIAAVAGLALLGATFVIEFAVLPRTRLGKKFFLQASSGSTSQPPLAEPAQVVGKTGEALTTLAPSGYVLVGGRRYEAASQGGLVEKGAQLKVVALDNFRLIVTKL